MPFMLGQASPQNCLKNISLDIPRLPRATPGKEDTPKLKKKKQDTETNNPRPRYSITAITRKPTSNTVL